jgi:predicted transcriptional regulator of viral defense system
MKNHLLQQLNQIHYFTIESYMQLTGLDETGKAKARNQLSRAAQSGQILRLKRGLYITANFYRAYHDDSRFLPVISQIIHPLSYVSSLYILQQENIIPEAVYRVTAINVKKTSEIENPIAIFTYQHIKTSLYLGFTFEEFLGHPYYIASPAKALFDYLYLRPIPRSLRKQRVSLATELRLNMDEWTNTQKEELSSYISLSRSEKMRMIFRNLEKHRWQH